MYAEVVGEDASREDYLRIAAHFQKKVDHLKAGQFFHKAGEYAKARNYTLFSLHIQSIHNRFMLAE